MGQQFLQGCYLAFFKGYARNKKIRPFVHFFNIEKIEYFKAKPVLEKI